MKIQKKLYAIYKYGFRRASERTITAEAEEIDGQKYLSVAHQCFNSLFDEKTIDKLYKTNKKGEVTRFPNDVMAQQGDIMVWRVNNSQIKEWWLKNGKDSKGIDLYEKKEVESNPFCNVLIDNRPDRCLIAIEKSPAWSSNPDALRNIILDNLNRILADRYDLEMRIEGLYDATDIYVFLDDRRDNHHDYIKRVTYEWKTRKAELDQVQNSTLKSMIRRSILDGALKGHYGQEYDEKSCHRINQKNKFMAEMVRLWNNGANVNVTILWHEYGRYRIGDYVKAFTPMPTDYLSDFGANIMTINSKTDLEEWFDIVAQQTKGYIYESDLPTHRK